MTDASGPKDISTLTPADWYKRFVFVVSDDCFFDVETQQEYIWLKEGFAPYASWLWDSRNDPNRLKRIAEYSLNYFFDSEYPVSEPSPKNLYTNESYTGGALVLYALQKEVGDETFFKILQTYAERYKYGNAGTDEFIAVANEVSGRDLKSFFNAWLFSPKLPEQFPE